MNSFQAHTNDINRIKQSPYNNDFVATCSFDLTVKIWNISNSSSWTLIRTYTNHTQAVFGLEWINEDTIASGSDDKTIKIWSISTGQTKLSTNTAAKVYSLKLLNDSFACGLGNGNINIYDINNNGSLISTLSGHIEWSFVSDMIQINFFGLLASSSSDGTIRIWDLITNTIKFNLTGHTQTVYGLKLVSSELLASGSLDNTIKLWNITDRQLIRNLSDHKGDIYNSIDFFSDSQKLVSGSTDQTIKIWDIATGECLNTFNTSLQIRSLTLLKSSFETTTTTAKLTSREYNLFTPTSVSL